METRKVRLITAGFVTFSFSFLFVSLVQLPARAGSVVVVPHATVVHTVPPRPYVHPHSSRATTTYWWWSWSTPKPCKKGKNGKCRS